MNKPLVAIIGRPNVGKSTLFNRIIGKRMAIVDDESGITRDRLYAETDWNGRAFVVIDTGGIILNDIDPLKIEVTLQAQVAMDEADVLVLMLDVVNGITPLDEEVVQHLRGSKKPVIVVANKADNTDRETDSAEFYALGFGNVFPISALNGRMVADLLDEIVRNLPGEGDEPRYPEDSIRIAIIGRPNVGKSSLINAFLGQKRVIVSDIAGTTRDSIDTVLTRDDDTYVLIDTAGIRKPGKIQGTIEYYTVLRALRAMERADVAIIVIDAFDGLCDGDKRVAGFAHEAGRACMLAINKWDLCTEREMKHYAGYIQSQIPFLDYAPVVFTSAKTGMGVSAIIDTAKDISQNHSLRIATGELNRLIHDSVDAHPYSRKGRELKVKYATMTGVKPPSIAIFVNDPELVHFSYSRYLENCIRKAYGYEGTPIRLSFRTAKKERGAK